MGRFADGSTIAACARLRIGARAGPGHEPRRGPWYRAVPGPAAGWVRGPARGLTRGPGWPADTGGMLRTVNHVARGLGFVWVGVLAFVLARTHGTAHLAVQIAGYGLVGA